MLPANFRIPAALMLVVGGALTCFAGYRLFKAVLAVYGFILGALIASAALGSDSGAWMYVAALAGGVVGALILVAAYFIGVALVGAAAAALLLHVVFAEFGREPHAILVIIVSIAGALAAMALQKYVIVLATAFGGAWTIVAGALALVAERTVRATERANVWVAYPLNPAPGHWGVIVAWLVLGTAGTLVQLRVTAKGRK
jgi:hypothetical protein